jgi:hypothetical protein
VSIREDDTARLRSSCCEKAKALGFYGNSFTETLPDGTVIQGQTAGTAICCSGIKVVCVDDALSRSGLTHPSEAISAALVVGCTREHELSHTKDFECSHTCTTTSNCETCKGKLEVSTPVLSNKRRYSSECDAYATSIHCLERAQQVCDKLPARLYVFCSANIQPTLAFQRRIRANFCAASRMPAPKPTPQPVNPLLPIGVPIGWYE